MSRMELDSNLHEQQSPEQREAALLAEIAELRRRLDQHSPAADDALAHARRPTSRLLWLMVLVGVAVIAIAFTAGLLPRSRRQAQIVAEAKAEAEELPAVIVTPALRSSGVSELSLPANIQGVTEAPILARADGYLKRRLVDIGDQVKAGQLLAEIEAPESDQQVNQAKAMVEQLSAAVEQAKAAYQQGKVNQDLARVTAERWGGLLRKGAVSPQENDQYQAQYRAQSANLEALDRARAAAEQNLIAAQANYERLLEVQGYKQVRAPFAGVVTVRNVDVGALISSGQTLLFRIAQNNVLRAYINIPQSESKSLRVGEPAFLELSQYPGQKFEGKVVRSASALDPSSRTLLAEVQVPNRNGMLLPGMYAQVSLRQDQMHPPLLAPGDTLIIGPQGTQVATVDSSGKVQFKTVVLGRDFGRQVEILQGLEEGDLLIANPNDRVRNGVKVRPQREKAEAGTRSSSAAPVPAKSK